jgi:hypothetical protein
MRHEEGLDPVTSKRKSSAGKRKRQSGDEKAGKTGKEDTTSRSKRRS